MAQVAAVVVVEPLEVMVEVMVEILVLSGKAQMALVVIQREARLVMGVVALQVVAEGLPLPFLFKQA
jgi:hypothetical protein